MNPVQMHTTGLALNSVILGKTGGSDTQPPIPTHFLGSFALKADEEEVGVLFGLTGWGPHHYRHRPSAWLSLVSL